MYIVSSNNGSLLQNEIIKWEFTIFTSQSRIDTLLLVLVIIILVCQQCINIMKQLYNNYA